MSTYKKVAKWNERCGNTPAAIGTQAYYDVIEKQVKRLVEELNETIEAIQAKDLVELMDGGLDLDVVVAGLNHLIGGDYATGISRVLANNEKKYTKSIKKARSWLMFHEDNGLEAHIQSTQIGSITYHCVRRDLDGKIMKYGNFPKVDLTDLIPEPETEVYLLVPTEASVTEELAEFTSGKGMAVIVLEQMPEEAKEAAIFAKVLEDAESGFAFVFIVNGVLAGAENFTEDGPEIGQKDTDLGEENE